MAIDPESGLGYIGEANTCDELESQITKEKFEDFPKRLMKNGKSELENLPFFICVPTECESKIKQIFEDFGISWRENIHTLSC